MSEYNETPNATAERRYGEHEVVLCNGGQILHGSQFAYYPVDEPPVIAVQSPMVELYRSVWESRGWVVNLAQEQHMNEQHLIEVSPDALYDAIGVKVSREEFRAVLLGLAGEAWDRGHEAGMEDATGANNRNPYR